MFVNIHTMFAEVERQLQGGGGQEPKSSPHLSSSKRNHSQSGGQGQAQSSHSAARSPLTNAAAAAGVAMTSRCNTAPANVQMRRATNTKGKPVPAPPKRTR